MDRATVTWNGVRMAHPQTTALMGLAACCTGACRARMR
jgi:hypothetical protein